MPRIGGHRSKKKSREEERNTQSEERTPEQMEEERVQAREQQASLLRNGLSEEQRETYDQVMVQLSELVSHWAAKKVLKGGFLTSNDVVKAAKQRAKSEAEGAVARYRDSQEAALNAQSRSGSATERYTALQMKASQNSKKSQKKAGENIGKEAAQLGAADAVVDIVRDYVAGEAAEIINGIRTGKNVDALVMSAYKHIKRLAKSNGDTSKLKSGGSIRENAKSKAEALAQDQDLQDRVVGGQFSGPIESRFKMIGQAIDQLAREDGEKLEAGFTLDIPVWSPPPVTVGMDLKGSVERDGGKTKLGFSAAVTGGLKAAVPGVELSALGKLGGYMEAEGSNAEECLQFMSYALYRKSEDIMPGTIGKRVRGWMWGMGGKSGEGAAEEADAWRDAQEEKMADSEGSVEMGVLAGVEGKAKAGQTGIGEVEAGASYEGKFGRKYDGKDFQKFQELKKQSKEARDAGDHQRANELGVQAAEQQRKARGGRSHHTHEAKVGVKALGIEGEAKLSWEKMGEPGQEEYYFKGFTFGIGGTIPFSAAQEKLMDPVLKLMGKVDAAAKAETTQGGTPDIQNEGEMVGNMMKDQIEHQMGDILENTAELAGDAMSAEGGIKISLEGGKERDGDDPTGVKALTKKKAALQQAGKTVPADMKAKPYPWKPFEAKLVFTSTFKTEIEAGIVGISLERARKLYEIPLIGG